MAKKTLGRKFDQWLSKQYLKLAAKVEVVFRNCYYATYNQEGPKTAGYFRQWEVLRYAFNVVYNQKNHMSKYVNGVIFNEDQDAITITLLTTKPGMIIGSGGNCIDELTKILTNCLGKKVKLDLIESEVLFGRQIKENY